jgi:hypothetical protein
VVLNLLVLAYPQIRIVSPLHTPKSKLYPFAYPPNQNFYPNELVLSGFQNLAYPLWASHVPLGVRVPQVENRWFKRLGENLLLLLKCWWDWEHKHYLQLCSLKIFLTLPVCRTIKFSIEKLTDSLRCSHKKTAEDCRNNSVKSDKFSSKKDFL